MADWDFWPGDFASQWKGAAEGMGMIGGIAGALGAGGPAAMSAFAGKLADKQNLELSQRWDGYQKNRARQWQSRENEKGREHDREQQRRSQAHDLTLKGTASASGNAAMLAQMTANRDMIPIYQSMLPGDGSAITDPAAIANAVGALGMTAQDSARLAGSLQQTAGEHVNAVKRITNFPDEAINKSAQTMFGGPGVSPAHALQQYSQYWTMKERSFETGIANIAKKAAHLKARQDATKDMNPADMAASSSAILKELGGLEDQLTAFIASDGKGAGGPAAPGGGGAQPNRFEFLASGASGSAGSYNDLVNTFNTLASIGSVHEETSQRTAAGDTYRRSLTAEDGLATWIGFGKEISDNQFTAMVTSGPVVEANKGLGNIFTLLSGLPNEDAARVMDMDEKAYASSDLSAAMAFVAQKREDNPVYGPTEMLADARAAMQGKANVPPFDEMERHLKALAKPSDSTVAADVVEQEMKREGLVEARLLTDSMNPGGHIDSAALDWDAIFAGSVTKRKVVLGAQGAGRGLEAHGGWDPNIDKVSVNVLDTTTMLGNPAYQDAFFDSLQKNLGDPGQIAEIIRTIPADTEGKHKGAMRTFKKALNAKVAGLRAGLPGASPRLSALEEGVGPGIHPPRYLTGGALTSNDERSDALLSGAISGRAVTEVDQAQFHANVLAVRETDAAGDGGEFDAYDLHSVAVDSPQYVQVMGSDPNNPRSAKEGAAGAYGSRPWLGRNTYPGGEEPLDTYSSQATTMYPYSVYGPSNLASGYRTPKSAWVSGNDYRQQGYGERVYSMPDEQQEKFQKALIVDTIRNQSLEDVKDPVKRRTLELVKTQLQGMSDSQIIESFIEGNGMDRKMFLPVGASGGGTSTGPDIARDTDPTGGIPSVATLRADIAATQQALVNLPTWTSQHTGELHDHDLDPSTDKMAVDVLSMSGLELQLKSRVELLNGMLAVYEDKQGMNRLLSNIGFVILGGDLSTAADDDDTFATRFSGRGALLGYKPEPMMPGIAEEWGKQIKLMEGEGDYAMMQQVMAGIVASADSRSQMTEGRRLAQQKEASRWTKTFMSDASLLAVNPEFAYVKEEDVPVNLRRFLPEGWGAMGEDEIQEQGAADPDTTIRPGGDVYRKSLYYCAAKLMARLEEEGGGMLDQ